jgi:hypothetical protein
VSAAINPAWINVERANEVVKRFGSRGRRNMPSVGFVESVRLSPEPFDEPASIRLIGSGRLGSTERSIRFTSD